MWLLSSRQGQQEMWVGPILELEEGGEELVDRNFNMTSFPGTIPKYPSLLLSLQSNHSLPPPHLPPSHPLLSTAPLKKPRPL